MAKLLLNECQDVEGTWYAPEKWLEEQRDVKRAELWETSSSAGDWSGYFVQKYKRRYWLIIFWQRNLDWTPYFRLTTAQHPIASFRHEPTKDECDQVREDYEREMLERIGSPLASKYHNN